MKNYPQDYENLYHGFFCDHLKARWEHIENCHVRRRNDAVGVYRMPCRGWKLMHWSVYIIESDDNSYYTGITTDVERRFAEHCEGPLGAKFFNGRTPLKIVYQEDGHTRSTASKREAEIKKLTRLQKQEFLASHSGR